MLRLALALTVLVAPLQAHAQSIDGRWMGRMEADFATRVVTSSSGARLHTYTRGTVTIQVELAEAQGRVTGSWTSGGASGEIVGTIDESGALELEITNNSGVAVVDEHGRILPMTQAPEGCRAVGRFTGSVNADGRITISSPRFSTNVQNPCEGWPLTIAWTLEQPVRFSGIGVTTSFVKDRYTITSVLRGGPADTAGIRAGDIIEAINEIPVPKIQRSELVNAIRGEPGTRVILHIRRGNATGAVAVTRQEVDPSRIPMPRE